MYLHVGTDVVVNLRQVIAILDLRSAGRGPATAELLDRLRREGRLTDISAGAAKSLVLTRSGGILSPISSTTLKRRSAASAEVCHL